MKGKHIGTKGEITAIEEDLITIKTKEGSIKTIIKNLIVTE